jgi:hypothetical protein
MTEFVLDPVEKAEARIRIQNIGSDGRDLLTAEVFDDALLGAAFLAHALDEVQVGVAVDMFLADKHPQISTPIGPILSIKIGIHAILFSTTHCNRIRARSTISTTYDAGEPKITPSLFKSSLGLRSLNFRPRSRPRNRRKPASRQRGHSHITVIPGASHSVFESHPTQVAAAIEQPPKTRRPA